MNILDMHVTPIAVADPPVRNSSGVHEPYALRTIVELVGEDGHSGWGEITCVTDTVAELERVRDLVIGREALDLNRLRREVTARLGNDPRAGARIFSALEVAALDLAGQALGVPVCELLGGRARDRVPFCAYLFYKYAGGGGENGDARPDRWGEALTPPQLVTQAKDFVATHGFKSIKLKAGVFEPAVEIETMRQLRDAFGPAMPLRIDPNCAWTVATSIAIGQVLAGTLEYFEDPTAGIDGMAAVRRGLLAAGVELPLATNMCVVRFEQIPAAARHDAVQVILGDHHFWGGLRAVVELGRICETFGIGMSMHSNSHLGVSLMAMVHLAAATPWLTYDCDTHYPWQDEADEILVGGKIPIIDGAITVPDRPGLGIEIDRDALARGHERYRRVPYRDRRDDHEMRLKYDPTWVNQLPRW
ncbi:MAG: glucarate dehydratase [Chloroflexota bacterium]|nr:glucarate dehydratase [Chloroflexota bacterium]